MLLILIFRPPRRVHSELARVFPMIVGAGEKSEIAIEDPAAESRLPKFGC